MRIETEKKYNDEHSFEFPHKTDGDSFQGSAVRKAILLTRYINFMRNFVVDVLEKRDAPTVNSKNGILLPPLNYVQSLNSGYIPALNPEFNALFEKFYSYFTAEADKLGDSDLIKELDILNKIKKNSEKAKQLAEKKNIK